MGRVPRRVLTGLGVLLADLWLALCVRAGGAVRGTFREKP